MRHLDFKSLALKTVKTELDPTWKEFLLFCLGYRHSSQSYWLWKNRNYFLFSCRTQAFLNKNVQVFICKWADNYLWNAVCLTSMDRVTALQLVCSSHWNDQNVDSKTPSSLSSISNLLRFPVKVSSTPTSSEDEGLESPVLFNLETKQLSFPQQSQCVKAQF